MFGFPELDGQPGSCGPKVALHRRQRQIHRTGDLLERQSAKIPLLDHSSLAFIELLQPFERLIEFFHAIEIDPGGPRLIAQFQKRNAPAAFRRDACAHMIDEHVPHHSRGDREKVITAPESNARGFDEAQVSLVNQASGIQRVLAWHCGKALVSESSEPVVYDWNELVDVVDGSVTHP